MPILLPELQTEDCCQSNVLNAAVRPMQGASRRPKSIVIGLSESATMIGRPEGWHNWLLRSHGVCEESRPHIAQFGGTWSIEYSTVQYWRPLLYTIFQVVGFVVRRVRSVSIGMTGADLTARWSLTEQGSRT